MRKNNVFMMHIFTFIGLIASCGSVGGFDSGDRSVASFDIGIVNDTARAGIIVRGERIGIDTDGIFIIIDDREIGTIKSNELKGYELANGNHAIYFEYRGESSGYSGERRTTPVLFTVNNDRHYFYVNLGNIYHGYASGLNIYYTGRGVPVDFSYANIGSFGADIVNNTARAGIIVNFGYTVPLHVFINNKEIGTSSDGRPKGCELENGTYTIFFEQEGNRKSAPIVFTVSNDRHVFSVGYDTYDTPVSYTGRGTPVPVPVMTADDSLFDSAIRSSFNTIQANLPNNSKIAIVNIVSPNSGDGIYILEELTVLFVNSRKFTIVDRQTLNAIMQERNFQLSGEVSDETVVSIGNFIGADIVITGTVSGDGERRRLRLRTLDVKTAQVLAASSERI